MIDGDAIIAAADEAGIAIVGRRGDARVSLTRVEMPRACRCASPSSASGISGGITRGFCRRCRASSSSAVVDTNRARAEEIAAAHRHAGRCPTTATLLGQVDAVTIAVPTERHRDVALPFLDAGVPVLVEKPMARVARRGRRR